MAGYSWNILHKGEIETLDNIIDVLLKNRDITDTEKFLNPTHPSLLLDENPELGQKFWEAKSIILKAIEDKLPIVIHGDYDVDGQTATAILWRTLYNDLNYKNTFPYIPNRFDEGYGVSLESLTGIRKLLTEKGFDENAETLLITVDCGIVSHKEIAHARINNFKVVLTDHHHASETLPEADAIVHTDKATGAGIAWLLANLILDTDSDKEKYLELAALGTICDLQPLVGINRSIAKFGINKLNNSDLAFVNAIKESAAITTRLDTYEIGWVIGPRLNATGRLESAMDSLRLLCSDSPVQAKELANQLTEINKVRQNQTETNLLSAVTEFKDTTEIPNFIVTSNENYHEGVIGLVAGKLVQTFYRPSIAISIKDNLAKGSARSIKGISIVETLKKLNHLFINVGGHDMAAGFSMEIENIEKLKEELAKVEIEKIDEVFTKQIDIDAEVSDKLLNFDTLDEFQKLKPFGMGNAEPVFLIRGMKIFNINIFGKENSHIKYFLTDENGEEFTALAFNRRDLQEIAHVGDKVDVVATLSKNEWNGRTTLELKLKDIKPQSSI